MPREANLGDKVQKTSLSPKLNDLLADNIQTAFYVEADTSTPTSGNPTCLFAVFHTL